MCPWQTQGWDFKWGINENALFSLLVVPLNSVSMETAMERLRGRSQERSLPGRVSLWVASWDTQLSAFTEIFAIVIYAWNMCDDSSWIPSLRSAEVVSPAPATWAVCKWRSSPSIQWSTDSSESPQTALLQMSPLLETLIPAFFFLKHGSACDLSTQTELGAVAEGQLC